MKYMLLIHHGTPPRPGQPNWDDLSDEEKGAIYTAYQELNETPGVTPGNGMEEADTATTVRVRDGEVLTTDGPYAELKDAIGGYAVLDVVPRDEAIAIAAKVPSAALGGGIEIRPVKEW